MNSLEITLTRETGGEFRDALSRLSAHQGAKHLILRPGKYIFRKKNSQRMLLPLSNTLTFGPPPWRHVGILLDGIDDLVIEGNGAQLLFDGDMTAIVSRNCRNLRLENLSVDYIRPRVSEMTVLRQDGCFADFAIHPDSTWTTDRNGAFCWVNADGVQEEGWQIVMHASPDRLANIHSPCDPIRTAVRFELLEPGTVRFHYPQKTDFRVGEIYQFRDPLRNEVGIALDHCSGVTFEKLSLFFTPGLGIVAQMCRDLTIRHHRHAPAPESGRVCSAFADCIQVSSCRGRVEITDSFFCGTHDDPINIHGTYLGLEEIRGNEITLKFRQLETWGFLPFEVGDEICFVRSRDLKRMESRTVKKAELTDMQTVVLELDTPLERKIIPSEYVVENLSAYPDVLIRGCVFQCHYPRGILMSSAGKCRIYDNEIFQTTRSAAVLIAGDAGSWYESGGVRDVKIKRNRICHSSGPAIRIHPEVGENAVVHRNIEICGNRFENCVPPFLQYRGTVELRTDLTENMIENLDQRHLVKENCE